MTLSALIVGDELKLGNLLQEPLQRFCPEVRIRGTARSPEAAFAAMHQYKIDVVFLDINLGNTYNGFELLDKLYRYDFDIVFVSAHKGEGVRAFAYDAAHYLLKPADYHMLMETIYRMKSRKDCVTAGERQALTYAAIPSMVALTDRDKTQFVSLDDVACLESKGSYTIFHLQDKQQYTKSRNLKYFEDALMAHTQFVRVHKSFIVNKKHIRAYRKSRQDLELLNGMAVPMSIGYRAFIEQCGDQFIQ